MNDKMLKFEDPDLGTIYLQLDIDENSSEWVNLSNEEKEENEKNYIKTKGKILLDSLKTFSNGVLNSVKHSKPTEIEVKAGMSLEFKEGNLIAYFAKASAKFPIEVTLKWTLKENELKDLPA